MGILVFRRLEEDLTTPREEPARRISASMKRSTRSRKKKSSEAGAAGGTSSETREGIPGFRLSGTTDGSYILRDLEARQTTLERAIQSGTIPSTDVDLFTNLAASKTPCRPDTPSEAPSRPDTPSEDPSRPNTPSEDQADPSSDEEDFTYPK